MTSSLERVPVGVTNLKRGEEAHGTGPTMPQRESTIHGHYLAARPISGVNLDGVLPFTDRQSLCQLVFTQA